MFQAFKLPILITTKRSLVIYFFCGWQIRHSAFLWKSNEGIIELKPYSSGGYSPNCLNNLCRIVGVAVSGNNLVKYLWTKERGMEFLNIAPVAINDKGIVIGNSKDLNNRNCYMLDYYNSNSNMIDIYIELNLDKLYFDDKVNVFTRAINCKNEFIGSIHLRKKKNGNQLGSFAHGFFGVKILKLI